jgi:hypothetical protein
MLTFMKRGTKIYANHSRRETRNNNLDSIHIDTANRLDLDTMSQSLGKDRGIATLDAARLGSGPITADVLRSIFTSDQDMYPAPLTFERLQSWVGAAPEISRCFYAAEEDEQVDRAAAAEKVLVGAIVAMPLREARWEALLNGTLKETDVEAAEDFGNGGGGGGIGVHVFHVEKFQGPRVTGFARAAVDTAVQSAMAAGRGPVVGISGT